MVFPAMKTGRLTMITGAMARELITDSSGKVTAVSYVDKATRTEKQIRCRAVVGRCGNGKEKNYRAGREGPKGLVRFQNFHLHFQHGS